MTLHAYPEIGEWRMVRPPRTPGRWNGAAAVGAVLVLACLAGSPLRAATGPGGRDLAVDPSVWPNATETLEAGGGFLPDDAVLEASGAVIGAITIRAGNVFNPDLEKENNRLFRLANRIHVRTRERTIRRLLLFHTGDQYSRRILEESERRLRSEHYLYDARIRPVRYQGNRVDVMVDTRDVWTLQGGVGFKRSGGRNETHFGLKDRNFLGFGKDLAIKRSFRVDRTSTLFHYGDHDLFGTQAQLGLEYADSSDGFTRQVDLGRPFFSLETRWAAGVRYLSEDRVDSLYDLGEVTRRFGHREDVLEVYGGWSRGLRAGKVSRWRAGFTYRRDRFGPSGDESAVAEPPNGRLLTYPWVEVQAIRERYIKTHDLDKLHRTEDVNLGRTVRFRLGLSSTSLGADRNRLITEFELRAGRRAGRRGLLLYSSHASGRFGSGDGENVLAGGRIRYFLRGHGGNLFLVDMQGDAAGNLDPENQLLLGGDNGLRGYPLRYLAGNRRYLLTVEKRYFTDWYPFRLFHVGGAVFLDVGRAWGAGYARSPAGTRSLKDVGVGLRLGSSRSSGASLVHVDLAFPLDAGDSISRVQFLVTTKSAF